MLSFAKKIPGCFDHTSTYSAEYFASPSIREAARSSFFPPSSLQQKNSAKNTVKFVLFSLHVRRTIDVANIDDDVVGRKNSNRKRKKNNQLYEVNISRQMTLCINLQVKSTARDEAKFCGEICRWCKLDLSEIPT